MNSFKEKKVLISGASMAGLSTAWWMNRLGYQVTVVEMAEQPRTTGAAVDIKGPASEAIKRMGLFEPLKSKGLHVDRIEFKNAADATEGAISLDGAIPEEEIEIERDEFVRILLDELNDDVRFIFNDSITALNETKDEIKVSFKNGAEHSFDLVFGCDGMHSGIRKIWFGEEQAYSHFLNAYFSITIVNQLLVPEKTMQLYNVPDKAITLNAYNNKTDIIFCFFSENDIPYNYRDIAEQRQIIREQFAGQSWRTAELLEVIQHSENFYFDKFCQIKMPSWTKGRVALVGDAGYCASPAAGMGASLAINGAAVLADALQQHNGNFDLAFRDYNRNLRLFIEEVQAMAAANIKTNFIPRTEEAIRIRNAQTKLF